MLLQTFRRTYWDGPEGKVLLKGETTVTSTTNIPPKTTQELELEDINLRIARQQESDLALNRALLFPDLALSGQIPGVDPNQPDIRQLLERQVQSQTFERQLEEEIAPQILARLRGESALTPDQQAALDELFGTQQSLGEEDIQRFARELAAMRGLSVTDTPVAREALTAQERLTRGLRGARAGAELDFGQSQQIFQNAVRQFQADLQQQAYLNRLSLASAQPLSLNLSNQLARERFASATTTQRTKQSTSFLDYLAPIGQGLSGAGTGLIGLSYADII